MPQPVLLISEPLGTEPLVDGPHSGNAVRIEVGLLAGRRQGLLRGQAVLVAEELFLGPPSHVRHHATSSPEVADGEEAANAVSMTCEPADVLKKRSSASAVSVAAVRPRRSATTASSAGEKATWPRHLRPNTLGCMPISEAISPWLMRARPSSARTTPDTSWSRSANRIGFEVMAT